MPFLMSGFLMSGVPEYPTMTVSFPERLRGVGDLLFKENLSWRQILPQSDKRGDMI